MKLLIVLITLAALPAFSEEAKGLIQLNAPLDGSEFYCLDVPGFRTNVQLEVPLMAHTCKPGAADEIFTTNHPAPGQLFMPAYNLCVQAESNQLYLKPCSSDPGQRFVITPGGQLRTADSGVCASVASGKGTPAGGPSHLRRDLTLKPCADAKPQLSQWKFGVSSPSGANR
jgi:hypothetical protein